MIPEACPEDPLVGVIVSCRLPVGVTAEDVADAAKRAVYRVAGNGEAYYQPHPDRKEGEEP